MSRDHLALLAALALSLVAAASPRAAAQTDVRPLPRGWSLHEHALGSGLEDVACGREVAFARSWFGAVTRWDGSRWASLPSRSDAMYGRTLAVSPGGVLFLVAGDHVARWDGAWTDLPLTAWEGDIDDQVVAPADDALLAVGRGRLARLEAGAMRTYDGGTWRELHAVALDGDDLLVAGQGGTILRHHGGAWQRERTGIATTVLRLRSVGPGDVWAWAEGEQWQRSILLHLEAGRWERRDLVVEQRVNALGGGAGGTFVTTDDAVLRWDAPSHAWTPELTSADLGPGHQLHGVCATDHHLVVGDRIGHLLVRPLAP